MDRVQLALQNATQTHALEIGSGVLAKVPAVFKSQFPHSKAVVVAHSATWKVAGEQVNAVLRDSGITVESPIIFRDADQGRGIGLDGALRRVVLRRYCC